MKSCLGGSSSNEASGQQGVMIFVKYKPGL
jgi:hypothetical protein